MVYKNNEDGQFHWNCVMREENISSSSGVVFIYIHNMYMYVQNRACYEGGKKKGKNGKDKK